MSVKDNKEIAVKINETAAELGWNIHVRGAVLTITKDIVPNCKDSFRDADMEYYSILDLLPQTSAGSVWGTDGGGMGAMVAMRTGKMTMNKSGGNKTILKELARLTLVY